MGRAPMQLEVLETNKECLSKQCLSFVHCSSCCEERSVRQPDTFQGRPMSFEGTTAGRDLCNQTRKNQALMRAKDGRAYVTAPRSLLFSPRRISLASIARLAHMVSYSYFYTPFAGNTCTVYSGIDVLKSSTVLLRTRIDSSGEL